MSVSHATGFLVQEHFYMARREHVKRCSLLCCKFMVLSTRVICQQDFERFRMEQGSLCLAWGGHRMMRPSSLLNESKKKCWHTGKVPSWESEVLVLHGLAS